MRPGGGGAVRGVAAAAASKQGRWNGKRTEIKGTAGSGCEAEPLSCSHYVNKPTLWSCRPKPSPMLPAAHCPAAAWPASRPAGLDLAMASSVAATAAAGPYYNVRSPSQRSRASCRWVGSLSIMYYFLRSSKRILGMICIHVLKFRYSEKATKIWKKSPTFFWCYVHTK